MLRLPRFKYLRPTTAREAARMAADLGPKAMFVAGGTDLFPKLKRRQFEVDALIALDFLPREVHNGSTECVVDAGVTLAAASRDEHLTQNFTGYAEAAGLVQSYREAAPDAPERLIGRWLDGLTPAVTNAPSDAVWRAVRRVYCEVLRVIQVLDPYFYLVLLPW